MIWSGSLNPSGITSVFSTTAPPFAKAWPFVFCFGEPFLWGALALTWATESILSCLFFRSSGRLGNGDVTRSRGSTTSLLHAFFFSGSEEEGSVGVFVFPEVGVYGRLFCLSWYLARFGWKKKKFHYCLYLLFTTTDKLTAKLWFSLYFNQPWTIFFSNNKKHFAKV